MTFTGIVKSAGVAALLTIVALSFAGCGRRGDLETAGAPSTKVAGTPASDTDTVVEGAGVKSASSTKAVAPKPDFLLDPLL